MRGGGGVVYSGGRAATATSCLSAFLPACLTACPTAG